MENELSSIRIAVLIPIGSDTPILQRLSSFNINNIGGGAGGSSGLTGTSSQDSAQCFSRPLISFTLRAFEKIQSIKSIILCGHTSKQEQIQELINEYSDQPDRIRYLGTNNYTAPHHNATAAAANQSQNNNNNNNNINKQQYHHQSSSGGSISSSSSMKENTINRQLKCCLNFLKRDELYDIIIVHDANLPLIDEEIVQDISLEALRSGASCLCTSELSNNLLLKLDESSLNCLKEEEDDEATGSFHRQRLRRRRNRSSSIRGGSSQIQSQTGLMQDYLDPSLFRIASKPQAFQYSIFKIMFENCSDEELDNNVDCIILAKKYADIRAKLVLNSDITNLKSQYFYINNYLKENHKQAILIDSKFDKDACHLQSYLRHLNWNIEAALSYGDIDIKINELSSFRNTTDHINLIKFCAELNEISNLKSFMFSKSEELEELGGELELTATSSSKQQHLLEISSSSEAAAAKLSGGGDSNGSDNNENSSSGVGPRPLSNYLVLLIKTDSIRTTSHNNLMNLNSLIRSELKKNLFLFESNQSPIIWHIVIVYDALSAKLSNLINYLLTDRDESVSGQIFECFDS